MHKTWENIIFLNKYGYTGSPGGKSQKLWGVILHDIVVININNFPKFQKQTKIPDENASIGFQTAPILKHFGMYFIG